MKSKTAKAATLFLVIFFAVVVVLPQIAEAGQNKWKGKDGITYVSSGNKVKMFDTKNHNYIGSYKPKPSKKAYILDRKSGYINGKPINFPLEIRASRRITTSLSKPAVAKPRPVISRHRGKDSIIYVRNGDRVKMFDSLTHEFEGSYSVAKARATKPREGLLITRRGADGVNYIRSGDQVNMYNAKNSRYIGSYFKPWPYSGPGRIRIYPVRK